MAGISGVAISEIAAGLVLCWSGIENQPIGTSLRTLISGQKLKPTPDTVTVDTNVGGGGTGSGPLPQSDNAIAADAEKYIGKLQYVFGGAPGPNGDGPVDCSSFASLVLGHDLEFQIPGGSWAEVTDNGNVHGPTTVSYLAWSGAETVGHSASVAQPGDLCVWQTHMGFCTGSNQMVSAQDPALGVGTSVIENAIPGEVLFVRRVIIGGSRG